MKRIVTSLIAMAALSCQAWAGAGDATVVVPRQYTQSMRHVLPDKSDRYKVQNLQLAGAGGLARAVAQLLDSVDRDNLELPLFAVELQAGQRSGTVVVAVTTHDPMLYNPQERKTLLGVAKRGSSYFVMPNSTMAVSLVQKAKGKTQFERVFELVTDPIPYRGTRVTALWDGERLELLRATVNGEPTKWNF